MMCLIRFSLISAVLICSQGCAPSPAATGSNKRDSVAQGDTTQTASESIVAMLGTDRAELSTATTSSADDFYVLFNASMPSNSILQPFTILVARKANRVAMLVQDMDGRCFMYATDHLLVAIDPARPGGLLCVNGGYPNFRLCIRKDHGSDLYFGFGQTPDSEIMLPFGDDIRDRMSEAPMASFDPVSRAYKLTTPRFVVQVKFFPAESPGPIKVKWLAARNEDNIDFGFMVGQGPLPAKFGGLFRDPLLTGARIRRLGLPIRDDVPLDEVSGLSIFAVPADFGRDRRDILASERLGAALANGPLKPPLAK